MATNLLIGYAEIPNAASSSSINNASSSMFPYQNLFGGNKTDLHYLNTATSGDTRITLDLGSGTTKSSNFIYIARANLLQQASVSTITLKGHSANNYAAATTVRTLSSFTSQTLYGSNSDDFIDTYSASSSFRYWFVNYNATAASKIPHAKLFFGTAFDPGIDPNANATITRIKIGGAQRTSSFSIDLTWNGITYSKAVEMYLNFFRMRRHRPIILFTRTWHDILMGYRVLFCRMTNMTIPPRVTGFCDVTATFEELL